MKTKTNMKLVLSGLILFIFTDIITGQVSEGLVGHFIFTNGSFADLSEYQDAVLSSNGDSTYYIIEDRFGNQNCAIDFQGAVLNAGINARDVTNEITVSLWMKTTQNSEDVKFLIYKYYCVEPPLGYIIAFVGDSVTFDGRDNTSNGYMRSGWSNTIINNGEWHHIVGLVRSEGIWELWIDNQKESYTMYSAINQLNHYFCDLGIAGTNKIGNTGIYHGVLDDIRFYNRALDSLEIDSLFYEQNPSMGSDKLLINSPEICFYPNPFTTSTTIEYELTEPSTVQLTIYDYLGKQVEVIETKQAQGKTADCLEC